MPDMWTHLVGGKRVTELIAKERWRRSVLAHGNTFILGCQAPDLFYYYNFQPWKRDKIGNLVSAAIHNERCRDFAVSLVHGLNPASPSYISDVVFVLGFLSHWVVDRVTHPYIHYISGFKTKLKASTVRSATPHKRIELLIDVLIAEKHLGAKPYRDSLVARLEVGPELPHSIANMLKSAISTTYPTIWAAQKVDVVERCYRDMLTSLSWSYDPSGQKKRFFWGALDKTFSMSSLTYFYPREVGPEVDYLNESRQEWSHPTCESEVSTETFHELLDRAVLESGELINSTLAYLESDLSQEMWIGTLGNHSYSTGKDSSHYIPLLYSRPLPVL